MNKVIGVLSILLFIVDEFDSCAVELGNILGGGNKFSGTAGMVLGLFMLVAGIVSLCSKKYRGRRIVSIILYSVAAFIGHCNIESYSQVKIWVIVNIAFASIILMNLLIEWNQYVFTEEELKLINEIKNKNKVDSGNDK